MAEEQNMVSLISENAGYITILLLSLTFKGAISELLKKITTFKYKNNKTQVELATKDSNVDVVTPPLIRASEEPTKNESHSEATGQCEQPESAFFKACKAASKGDKEKAMLEFDAYAATESNAELINKNKAYLLFTLFESGEYKEAINELKQLIDKTTNENCIFNAMMWLSFCYTDSSEITMEIELWEQAKFESTQLHVKSIVNLSNAIRRNNNTDKARTILIDELSTQSNKECKALIYKGLSDIERESGNKDLSIYCKDKALQFSPLDKDMLFDVAYEVSDTKAKKLSIVNYSKLIDIDSEHAGALNNLGVIAQNLKQNIIAVNNYSKSSKQEHTLSMANQGYLLFNAGFVEEAETIANKAIELGDPHNNIYKLKNDIHEAKIEQEKVWEKTLSEAKKYQTVIRKYTENYYESENADFDGEWFIGSGGKVDFLMESNDISAEWADKNNETIVKLTAKCTNSTLQGYIQKDNKDKSKPIGLLSGLGGHWKEEVIGLISKNEELILHFINSEKEPITFTRSNMA